MDNEMIEIKTRHIKDIYTLPVSELTDEEILKVTVKRVGTKAAVLAYQDPDTNRWIFLGRYKTGGYPLLTALKRAWEDKFGKFKKEDYEE